jgi:DNA mismatch repair ATPase MutS
MASFEIDKQTIKDLDLFNEDGVSVYSLFNQVKTIGGKAKLQELMQTPTSDLAILTSRRDSIKFFQNKTLELKVNKNDVDFVEHYTVYNCDVLKPNIVDALVKRTAYRLNPGKDYYTIEQGIRDTWKLLKAMLEFYNDLVKESEIPVAIHEIIKTLGDFLNKKPIGDMLATKSFGFREVNYYDNMLRNAELVALKNVLKAVYELDAYISIAKAIDKYGFCFPEYEVADLPAITITDLHHPFIKNAVTNDVLIDQQKNVWFLTGANMAGKSTFLKSLSLAVYLAHVGLPVPAAAMKTTLFKGLITTVNLSDNINSGYSHYFSEVKRLKNVAEKIINQDNLFVVFDELFRGTNVKDAYDASLATISALSKIKSSVFLISTHIVEIAPAIEMHDNVVFKFFDSQIEDGRPVFDFKLNNGVSTETLGYFIFKNEGILQILEQAGSR